MSGHARCGGKHVGLLALYARGPTQAKKRTKNWGNSPSGCQIWLQIPIETRLSPMDRTDEIRDSDPDLAIRLYCHCSDPLDESNRRHIVHV